MAADIASMNAMAKVKKPMAKKSMAKKSMAKKSVAPSGPIDQKTLGSMVEHLKKGR